ncbi:MAG: hypothetical protein AAFZ11_11710 [Pseudomonadota bacterium]
MSVISLMVFDPAKLPTLELIEAEAANGGDQITFPDHADLLQHTGYLPAIVNGRETGFEHYFEPIPAGALPDEVMAFGSHHAVTRTGSDFEEGRAALVYLRVLSRLTGGAYLYPDDGIVVPPEAVQGYLAEQITEYGEDIQ